MATKSYSGVLTMSKNFNLYVITLCACRVLCSIQDPEQLPKNFALLKIV